MGKLLAICTSPKRGTVKTEVPSAVLTPEWGIVEDAHGGNWHRQVSMLSAEKIEAFRKKIWVDYGAFGENLVIEGFDFRNLPVTSRFAIGDVVLEMTQIGKECHNDCVIKQQTGECIMPHEGVFARVLTGGEIHVGDEVTLLPALENPPLRAAVITLSDKGSRGEREDKSGPLIVEMLTATGYKVEETLLLPDDAAQLKTQLLRLADARQVNLILTTGGTGFAPRDITPEATLAVADRIGVMNHGRIEQIADPQTLYRRPGTEYVATFIGLTNRLPGIANGEEAVVFGQRVPLLDGSATDASTVLVRPENMTIELTNDADAVHGAGELGRVEMVHFLGALARVDVRVACAGMGGTIRVTVQLPANELPAGLAIGAQVVVAPRPIPALAV